MLILDRYPHETVCIDGTAIQITVLGPAAKRRVRLGIEAPEHPSIDRNVYNRRAQQAVRLHHMNIRITVLGISRNGRVRLGIEAPDDVSIHRLELLKTLTCPTLSLAKRN